jgi:hypothetical protein
MTRLSFYEITSHFANDVIALFLRARCDVTIHDVQWLARPFSFLSFFMIRCHDFVNVHDARAGYMSISVHGDLFIYQMLYTGDNTTKSHFAKRRSGRAEKVFIYINKL